MSKQVYSIDQGHNGGGGGENFRERYADQRIDNNRQSQHPKQQGNGNNNQGQHQNNQGKQRNDVQRPSRDTSRIYQRVAYLKLGDETWFIPSDNDYLYEDGSNVDMRVPRRDVTVAGYMYALEGKTMLIDAKESPDSYLYIKEKIDEFFMEMATLLQVAAWYEAEHKNDRKRPAKTVKNNKEQTVTSPGLSWQAKAAIIVPTLIIIALLILSRG